MKLSHEAKLVSGLILLSIPTIMYGGITLLSILTNGSAGFGAAELELSSEQWSLWRAGHAHAGVWIILSLVMQLLIDGTALSAAWRWTARLGAPLAAVMVSGGFFGLAFIPAFQLLIYAGGLLLIASLLITGVGLISNRSGGSDK